MDLLEYANLVRMVADSHMADAYMRRVARLSDFDVSHVDFEVGEPCNCHACRDRAANWPHGPVFAHPEQHYLND